MKQCPQCDELFEDERNFCDIDGTPLIDEAAALRATLQSAAALMPDEHVTGNSSSNVIWVIALPAGIVIGVLLSLLFYAVNSGPSQNREPHVLDKAASAQPQQLTIRSQAGPALAAQTVPIPSPEASAQEETAAETTPAPVASPVNSTTVSPGISLNDGPVSTGNQHTPERSLAVIKLKDGSSVEAEAAWEDKQGIWYRRAGLVSFLDRERVATITASAPNGTSRPDAANR